MGNENYYKAEWPSKYCDVGRLCDIPAWLLMIWTIIMREQCRYQWDGQGRAYPSLHYSWKSRNHHFYVQFWSIRHFACTMMGGNVCLPPFWSIYFRFVYESTAFLNATGEFIKTGTVKRAIKTTKKLNDQIITLMWDVCVIFRLDCWWIER